MKFPLPDDTFPTLKLSRADEHQLAQVAEVVVKTAVDEYLDLLTRLHGVVDERRWKLQRQRENVRVYRERSSAAGSSKEDKAMTRMLTFGSVDGNLDDVVYGIMCPTTAEMHLKSLYVEDGLCDWGVLAKMIRPSESEPMREFGIKWIVKENPAIVRPIMRVRDTVYIDSIGFVKTPNGEQIAYTMWHSVEVPELRELTELSIVRAKVSFCTLMRQRAANSVEVFTFGTICAMGDVPASLMAISTAEAMASLWKNAYCAEMKKLTRLLSATHSPRDQSTASTSSSGSFESASSGGEAGYCAQCMKASRTRLIGSSTKLKQCALCTARVCSNCRVKKTVGFPSASNEKRMLKAKKRICTQCMFRVARTSSAVFAALDARAERGEQVDYMAALAS